MTATWIDVKTNTRVATIKLGGAAGNTQYDPVSNRIYVNVQGRRVQIAVAGARKIADRLVGPSCAS